MAKTKYGIIGLGWFGEYHGDALAGLPNVEIHALCTRTESKLKEMGKKFGVKKLYTDYHQMLADPEIDAVSITTMWRQTAPSPLRNELVGWMMPASRPLSRCQTYFWPSPAWASACWMLIRVAISSPSSSGPAGSPANFGRVDFLASGQPHSGAWGFASTGGLARGGAAPAASPATSSALARSGIRTSEADRKRAAEAAAAVGSRDDNPLMTLHSTDRDAGTSRDRRDRVSSWPKSVKRC